MASGAMASEVMSSGAMASAASAVVRGRGLRNEQYRQQAGSAAPTPRHSHASSHKADEAYRSARESVEDARERLDGVVHLVKARLVDDWSVLTYKDQAVSDTWPVPPDY